MEIPDIFPKDTIKLKDDISNKRKMDYYIGVWCMNSMAAEEGWFRKGCILPNERDGKTEIVISIEDAKRLDMMIQRMMDVYTYLWTHWDNTTTEESTDDN